MVSLRGSVGSAWWLAWSGRQLLGVLLPGVLLSGALLSCRVPAPRPLVERLVILHTNDLHGQVRPRRVVVRPGFGRLRGGHLALAVWLDRVRAAAGPTTRVWVTDGGDWFQGTPEGNEDRGLAVMACRNRLDLVAAVVGNHDYDYGEANLIRLIAVATHPVLGANVVERSNSTRLRPYVEPFVVRNLGGLQVALVGLIASDTKNVSTGPFGEAEFLDERAALRALWPRLQQVADEVILITHCGLAKDRELARAFPEIRLVLGGHSHTALPRGHREGDTWIAQGGGHGTSISRVDLRVDLPVGRLVVESVRLQPVEAAEVAGAGPRALATATFLAATFAHIGPKWDRPVGRITGARDRQARGRGTSTPAGNYIADLLRRAGRADIGLMNKGGIRSVLVPGPITRRQVFQLLPFDNSVYVMQLSGAELGEVLAQGLRPGRQPLEIAGASYGFAVIDGRRQLRWVRVAGQPAVAAANYRVATNSFLATGGDGFTRFAVAAGVRVGPQLMRTIMLTELRRHGEVRLSDERRIRLVK